jgi:sporulation protein YlmC with PRC-barrel domain
MMERNLHSLIGESIGATNGEIGKVEDFYFEDDTWTIRYLVVKTGAGMSGRKVLISPNAFPKHAWASGMFRANLTREQVRNSPDIDSDKPVSRQQEAELANYYPWQPYWGSGYYAGGVYGIIEPEGVKNSTADLHLRSCRTVTGYHVHASDGEIGHVNDFIMDDETWQIVYVVVDTHNWIGSKKVLVAVRHIKEVQWANSTVVADVTIDVIKNGVSADKSGTLQ